jgi:hypothetical protein
MGHEEKHLLIGNVEARHRKPIVFMFDECSDTTARRSPDQAPENRGMKIAIGCLARSTVGATPLPPTGPDNRSYRPS